MFHSSVTDIAASERPNISGFVLFIASIADASPAAMPIATSPAQRPAPKPWRPQSPMRFGHRSRLPPRGLYRYRRIFGIRCPRQRTVDRRRSALAQADYFGNPHIAGRFATLAEIRLCAMLALASAGNGMLLPRTRARA
jgi:hypothetical protein